MTTINEKLNVYFEKFSQKDVQSLQNMFAENISIQDWDASVNGMAASMEFIVNIFNSVDNIEVKVLKSCICENVAYCELFIEIDAVGLHVLDVISFNNDGLINNVTAYKR